MTVPASIRQKAIALVERLPEDQLLQVVDFLEILVSRAVPPDEVSARSPQEEVLLQTIQRRLPPGDQSRLQYLREQNESGTITDAEHQELLQYVDRIEQQDAERAAALIQLAQLRNVDLKALVKAFLPIQQVG